MASQSSMFVEFTVWADNPIRPAASTWSRMRASSGDTTSVGPAPASRRSRVAIQYTADFPQPVRCTTRTRLRSLTNASIAASWSSRSLAWSPARVASSAWARSATSVTGPGATPATTRGSNERGGRALDRSERNERAGNSSGAPSSSQNSSGTGSSGRGSSDRRSSGWVGSDMGSRERPVTVRRLSGRCDIEAPWGMAGTHRGSARSMFQWRTTVTNQLEACVLTTENRLMAR